MAVVWEQKPASLGLPTASVAQPGQAGGSEQEGHREGNLAAPGQVGASLDQAGEGHHRLTRNPHYQDWGYELPSYQFIKGRCDGLSLLNQCPYSPRPSAVLLHPGHHFFINLHLPQPPPLI